MRYLILGAGGVGGALGAHLARGGKDVTFLARGEKLAALRDKGLRVEKPGDPFSLFPVSARDPAAYTDRPDVIFLCVKGYSLEGVLPLLERLTAKGAILIPLLNLVGTGQRLQAMLPGACVTEGCIYIASQLAEPGLIRMQGSILRVIYGVVDPARRRPELEEIRRDLTDCGVEARLSPRIRRDCLEKFSYVSPQGACGLYYGVSAGALQRPGEMRDCFAALVREVGLLARAMGAELGDDLVRRNLAILDGVEPEMTTSLQRDVLRGGPSELDGLVLSVPRLARQYGLALPTYEKIAAALRAKD